MSSKIKVDTIENVAGSGNVSLGSGHNLVVPGNITGQGTAAITSNATVGGTLGVTGETTLATHLNMGDNAFLKIGTGNDLQLYHTGSHSYIDDLGTGNLNIRATSALNLGSPTGDTYATFAQDGAATLFFDNAAKVATNSGGVTVTGNVVSNDGSNNARFQYDNNNQILIENDSAMNFYVNGSNSLKIDSAGHVTKPLQSAFYVETSATQTDFGLSSTHTLAFGTERFDQNSDFASNIFTAPVTGRYFLHTTLRLESIDSAAVYYLWGFDTSNHDYLSIIQPKFSEDLSYISVQQTVVADMDANDTAKVIFQQVGGTQQTDLQGAGGYSYFCGHLVA